MVATLTTLPSTDLSDALDAYEAWRDVLRTEIVDGAERIHLLALALACRESLWYIGLKGVAKTYTVDRGMKHIGNVRYFKRQVGPFAQLEDKFGPMSLAGLEHDRFERVKYWFDDDGNRHEATWAQHAHVVCMDEELKASPGFTVSGLDMMNEREINDNGRIIKTPTACYIVTSNEEQQDSSQDAYVDRLLLTGVITRPTNRADRERLITMPDPDPNPTPAIDWSQWEIIQAAVRQVPYTQEVVDAILDIEDGLLHAGIDISPRRLRKCLPFVQAEALLSGATEATLEHAAVLEHCAWPTLADRYKAIDIVLNRAAPVRKTGLELLKSIEEAGARVDALLAPDNPNRADVDETSTLQAELTSLKWKVDSFADDAGSGQTAELAARCAERQNAITMRLLVEGMGLTPAAVQNMFAQLNARRG